MSENRKEYGKRVFESGKIPPQAIDLEKAILGSIMLDKSALVTVMELITSEVFYVESHQLIYKAICDLFSKNEPADILTTTNQLLLNGKLEEVGGAYYVTQLTNRIGSTVNVEYHTRIILQKYFQREIIRTSSEHIKIAYEETTDVFDLKDKVNVDLLNLMQFGERKQVSSISDIVEEVEETTEKLRSGEIEYPGIYVKLGRWDDILKGFSAPDLIIIAGRASMGKTAIMITLARKIAMQNIPVGIFSLEMSKQQVSIRLISQQSGVAYNRIKMGNIDPEIMKESSAKIKALPIQIDDTPALTLLEFKSKLFQMILKHNIKIVFIDYIQLMSGIGFNREQEVSGISRGLKAAAKEANVPIVAFSQINRAVETRGDRKPQLSDLRESGAIEQDADAVLMAFRPEYYNIKQDSDGMLIPEGRLEIGVKKNRNGPLGTINLHFDKVSMNIVSDDDVIDDMQESELDFNSNKKAPF